MTYLIAQMWFCLLLAALLGFLIGWLWRGRKAEKEIREARSDLQRQLAGREDDLRRVRGELETSEEHLKAANEATAKERADLEAASEQQEKQQKKIDELKAELDEERGQIVFLKGEAERSDQALKAEQEQLTVDWQEKLEAANRVTSDHKASLKAAETKASKQRDELQKQLKEAVAELEKERSHVARLQSEVDRATQSTTSGQDQLVAEWQEKLAACEKRLAERVEAEAAALEKGAATDTKASEDQQRLLDLEAALNTERAIVVDLRQEIEQAKLAAGKEREQLEKDWRGKLDTCEKRLASAQAEAAEAPSADSSLAMGLAAGLAQLTGPPPDPDDLKKIKGIGKVLERFLNDHGVYTYRQIANWTQADIDYLSAELPQFTGRIERDDWIGGAREQHFKKYGEEI